MTMPEAAEATLALASAPRSCLKQNVYAVGGFAPTAAELEEALQERFPDFEVEYDVHPIRSGIVDSWPADVDDSAARRDWGFRRGLDLAAALDDYLIPGIRNAARPEQNRMRRNTEDHVMPTASANEHFESRAQTLLQGVKDSGQWKHLQTIRKCDGPGNDACRTWQGPVLLFKQLPRARQRRSRGAGRS